MAYLAVRGSAAINGVSRLHGAVSRGIFSSLFPRWPLDEVPVGHVTNGVHTPTWDSAEADDLWTKFAGKDRWMGETDNLERDIRRVTDPELWQCRASAAGLWWNICGNGCRANWRFPANHRTKLIAPNMCSIPMC